MSTNLFVRRCVTFLSLLPLTLILYDIFTSHLNVRLNVRTEVLNLNIKNCIFAICIVIRRNTYQRNMYIYGIKKIERIWLHNAFGNYLVLLFLWNIDWNETK